MRHCVAVKRPCFRYIGASEDIFRGEKAGERSARNAMMNRSRLLEIEGSSTRHVEDGNEITKEEEG